MRSCCRCRHSFNRSSRGRDWSARNLHHTDGRRQSRTSALAHLAMPLVHRVVRAATHAGEEVAVHLDDVVEDGLLRLGEEAGNQGVTFAWREALEVIDVVAATEIGQVLDHLLAQPQQVEGLNTTAVRLWESRSS
jgi:hypothetical protein